MTNTFQTVKNQRWGEVCFCVRYPPCVAFFNCVQEFTFPPCLFLVCFPYLLRRLLPASHFCSKMIFYHCWLTIHTWFLQDVLDCVPIYDVDVGTCYRSHSCFTVCTRAHDVLAAIENHDTGVCSKTMCLSSMIENVEFAFSIRVYSEVCWYS